MTSPDLFWACLAAVIGALFAYGLGYWMGRTSR